MNDFLEFLAKKKKVLVVGKGDNDIIINDNYDLYIGIKQSIGILPQKDILIMNDMEGILGLENCFKDIKYILFPNVPHCKKKPDPSSKQKILDYLKIFNFKGKIINYEISSNKNKDKNLEYVACTRNSGDIIYHFYNLLDDHTKKTIKIDILGMYGSNNDNKKITDLIINAKVPEKYKEIHKSYLSRTYKNKKSTNIEMFTAASSLDSNLQDINEIKTHLKNKLISSYPDLNINFL